MAGRSRIARPIARLRDGAIRWARMPRLARPERRRFLVIQIDGLSYATLKQALDRRHMPFAGRLLRRGQFRLVRLPVGLPTSTPAFQAGLMYGGPVDIPAFEYVDKRTGEYVWFPRPWASARVEAAHATGRRGIMTDGRTYGCVFGGGAADSVLTFAHLLRPAPRWGRFGLRARLMPVLVLAWVTLKTTVVTVFEILRWTGAAVRDFSIGRRITSPKRLLIRLLISGWLRELFTLGVTADVYAGVPAIYVNFVDYDVPAHELGPDHPGALRELRYVDRSIRDIVTVVRRVPELRYDVFVLSDHGQTLSVPFETVAGGESVVDAVLKAFQPVTSAAAEAAQDAVHPFAVPLWPFAAVWQRHLAYLQGRPRNRNAVWAQGLCVVPAGPNINIYLTGAVGHAPVEEIETRYPGALRTLSRHPGIGLVLARGGAGPVCYYRGAVLSIPPPPGPSGCPLFDRPDRPLVVEGLRDLLTMPSAGDIVVFGHYTAHGCVSYLGERGSHAGPSEDELYAFVMAPPDVKFDFESVSRPTDLYPLFVGYHEEPAQPRGGEWEG